MPSVALDSQTRAAICNHLQLHVNVCAVRLGAIVLAASWPSTQLPPPRRWRVAEPVRTEQAYAVLWPCSGRDLLAAAPGVFFGRRVAAQVTRTQPRGVLNAWPKLVLVISSFWGEVDVVLGRHSFRVVWSRHENLQDSGCRARCRRLATIGGADR